MRETPKLGQIHDDIFKPASTQDLETRTAEYYKTPEAINLKQALDTANEAIKQYQNIFEEEFSAGHARDSKNMVEFSIKMHRIDIPQDVLDKAEKLGVTDQLDHYFWEELPDQLKFFVEWLQEDFPFIEDYYQEGRSGGWLLLKLSSLDGLIEDIEFTEKDYINLNLNPGEIRPAIKLIKDSTRSIENRIRDIYKIAKRVEKSKTSLAKEMSSPEYWDRFFEIYADEAEEEKKI
jgi:hypothetical protein